MVLALQAANSSVVRTPPPTRRPTPVALSKTILVGTPPTCSKTLRRAWQTHSDVSPGKTWASPTLEYGNVITKKLSVVRIPLT